MIRHAVLINAGNSTSDRIPGCQRDVERLKDWLTSTAGGAWNSNEIDILHNPSKSEILLAKVALDRADFAFLSFSGHGRIVENSVGSRAQIVTVGAGDEMDFDDLKPRDPKSILSCDACRKVHRLAESRHATATKSLDKLAREIKGHTRQDYRNSFERAVELTPAGVFTMYSCSPGQFAGEDPLNGGVFTDALLNRASEMDQARLCLTEALRRQ